MVTTLMYYLWIVLQLITATAVIAIIAFFMWCVWLGKAWSFYQAKKAIIPWVEGYKRRCTAQNRFVVTVETLQDSFREFDTPTIERVWKVLIDKRVIQQDPQDNEWCIR